MQKVKEMSKYEETAADSLVGQIANLVDVKTIGKRVYPIVTQIVNELS